MYFSFQILIYGHFSEKMKYGLNRLMHVMKMRKKFERYSNSKLPGLDDLSPEFWRQKFINYSMYNWEYTLSLFDSNNNI